MWLGGAKICDKKLFCGGGGGGGVKVGQGGQTQLGQDCLISLVTFLGEGHCCYWFTYCCGKFYQFSFCKF